MHELRCLQKHRCPSLEQSKCGPLNEDMKKRMDRSISAVILSLAPNSFSFQTTALQVLQKHPGGGTWEPMALGVGFHVLHVLNLV